MAEENKGLQDAFNEAGLGMDNMADYAGDLDAQLGVLSGQMKNLIDITAASVRSTEDMMSATTRASDAANKHVESLKKEADAQKVVDTAKEVAMKATTAQAAGLKFLSDGMVSLMDSSRVTSTAIGGMTTALALFNVQAGPLLVVMAAIKGVVDAYDISTKSIREVVKANLMAGSSYTDNAGIIDANQKKLSATAAAWGLSIEQGSKFQQMFAGVGIGARQGETGAGRAKTVGEEINSAFEASARAAHTFGITLDSSASATSVFGTVMDLRGTEFSRIMDDVGEAGRKSALGSKQQIETVKSITETSKEYAPNLFNINVLTSAFSREIKAGTISMETISKLANPARLGTEGLAFVASMAQQAGKSIGGVNLSAMTLPRAMDAIAASGEKFNQLLKGGKIDPKEAAESLTLVTDALRQAVPDIANMSGMEIQQILKSIGIDTSIVTASKIFSTDVGSVAKELAAAAAVSAKADPAQRLKDAGELIYDKFKTSSEALQPFSTSFSGSVKDFGDYVKDLVGEAGGLGDELQKRAKESPLGYFGAAGSMAKDISLQGMKELATPEGFTGAARGAVGMAKHISGANLSISIGDLVIGAAKGDMSRKPIHDAMVELEERIYRKLSEQESLAAHAQ